LEKNKCTRGLTEAAFKVRSEGVGVRSVAQADVGEAEEAAEAEAEAKAAIADRPRCIEFELYGAAVLMLD
jgi:hypothetical protein